MASQLCVFTCDYGNSGTELLTESCVAHGIDLQVYGRDRSWPGFVQAKLTHAREFLETRSEPYCLYTDGYDSFVNGTANQMLEAYFATATDVLISAEKNCYPASELGPAFPKCETPWKYLCAGGWIGKTGELIETLRLLENISKEMPDESNDQAIWSYWYVTDRCVTQNAKLDSWCQVFQSMANTDEMDPSGLNRITNTRPLVWHFNGRVPGREDWYRRLRWPSK